jgi:hypothetical protein
LPTDAEIFAAARLSRARVLIAGGQPLPTDLRDWVLEQLDSSAPAKAQLARRDEYLVLAASMVPGTTRARALAILAADNALRRNQGGRGKPSMFLDAVRKARACSDIPGERQIRDILAAAQVGSAGG